MADLIIAPETESSPAGAPATDAALRRERIWHWVRDDSPSRRVALAVAAVAIAFHLSLSSLIGSLGVDSPLAYLGLVPFIALALAIARGRPSVGELAVHDRYLDRILAAPLLIVPLVILALVPHRLGTLFWLWRVDLLALPFFAAGVVTLLFGTRTMLRSKAGLLFLFVAWPAPFQYVLQRWLDSFTSTTVSVVGAIASTLHLANRAGPSLDGGFVVSTPSGSHFTVMVASQCSGANSMLGFLLIAAALLVVLRGPRRKKASWLVVGGAIVWAANIVRITLIFLSGVLWGERVAIDGFHPYIGLVTFGLAMAGAVWLLPRFGLTFGVPRRNPELTRSSLAKAVPTIGPALLIVAALVVPTAVADGALSKVDPIASALGLPRLHPFSATVMDDGGFQGAVTDNYSWARRYFGDDSDWTRYQFTGGAAHFQTSIPIVADVVTTSDSATFDNFGVEACYAFHGYDVTDRRTVDLGTGVSATMLTWRDPELGTRWVALFWYWPVLQGGKTRFQRIVLLYAADELGSVIAPTASPRLRSQLGIAPESDLHGAGSATDLRDATRRQLLAAFGRRLVANSVSRATGSD